MTDETRQTITPPRPMGDRVIVSPLKGDEYQGAIKIIDTAQDSREHKRGMVVAVGPGRRLRDGSLVAPPVVVGEVVIWRKFTGAEATVGGVDFVILSSDELLGVSEGD